MQTKIDIPTTQYSASDPDNLSANSNDIAVILSQLRQFEN